MGGDSSVEDAPVSDAPVVPGRPAGAGRLLVLGLAVVAAWDAWCLVRHSGFQPDYVLRTSAPVIALMVGAVFTRVVALLRARADAEREFDAGGKALFMGFVMVGVTALAWLWVSQALPATVTALTGSVRSEAGVVVRQVPATGDEQCPYRLEVASADAAAGAVQRPLDECVDQPLWKAATAGGAVTLSLVAGPLGAELLGVEPAPRR
jgi:hypothetical protein